MCLVFFFNWGCLWGLGYVVLWHCFMSTPDLVCVVIVMHIGDVISEVSLNVRAAYYGGNQVFSMCYQ